MRGAALGLPGITALAAAALVFVLLVASLYRRMVYADRYRARVLAMRRRGDGAKADAEASGSGALGVIQGLGELVSRSGLLSKRTLQEFQQTLVVAGFRGRGALGLLVGGKMLLLTLLPALAWLLLLRNGGYSASLQLYVPVVTAIAGLMVPDLIIRSLRKRHIAALEVGLADALDLLVICSEAGLGLEPGLERVGHEIRVVHPAVAEEMTQTSQEMRVNADRRVALINMGKRTGVESLRRLGGTMVQSMQYGTPLSDALRVLSAELRQEALNRFETKAGRLSVLLTMPMIIFILPCVFLIVGGPAIVKLLQTLRH